MMYVLGVYPVTAIKKDSLFVFGGNQQSERATYTERLADHDLHLGEGPQEHQVFINGVDLLSRLQARHLHTVNPTQKQAHITEVFTTSNKEYSFK